MTIQKAIKLANDAVPNSITDIDKVGWLSNIDALIKCEIIDTHEGNDAVTFTEYNDETSQSTELIAVEPYSELYVRYLESQINLKHAEMTRYNNSIVLFDKAYTNYTNYYNRTHMPLQQFSIKL